MKNPHQPINPMPHQNTDGTIQHDVYFGLTKREYFAGLAMQALISNPEIQRPRQNDNLESDLESFSQIAIEYADSLLKELDNTK
jgi:hypothetical protein